MTPSRTPTMKDVAACAGVSLGTVSKVINHIPVGQKNKEKVEAAIKELGYEVNTYARGLKIQETKLITLIVPDTTNPFNASFTQYVEQNLYQQGYKLILCCSNGLPEKEISYLNLASQSKTDGIIALTYTDVSSAIPARIPLVSFDRYFENHDVPMIASDNFQGGYTGTKKAAGTGLSSSCVYPLPLQISRRSRQKNGGYLSACQELGIQPDYLDQVDAIEEKVILEEFIQEHTDSHGNLTFDGVFANTDRHAYLVMKILKERGIRVPEDVQMLGYDGIRKLGIDPESLYLSSMCQPVEELARLCVEILLKKRQGAIVPSLSLLPVTYGYGGTTRRES